MAGFLKMILSSHWLTYHINNCILFFSFCAFTCHLLPRWKVRTGRGQRWSQNDRFNWRRRKTLRTSSIRRKLRNYRYNSYLFTFPNLSVYLSVSCLFVCLSRWYWKMYLLKGGVLRVSCQPMSCSVPPSITALISFYGNTVCLPPSTHTQQPAVMSTATGSTRAWLQGPIKVITPVLVRKPRPSPDTPGTDTAPVCSHHQLGASGVLSQQ